MVLFNDRFNAGSQLADILQNKSKYHYDLVLALPRGGVPVAYAIAKKLEIPLDVFIVRKLGTPGQAELAMGAIATGDICIFNNEIINKLQVTTQEIQTVIDRELAELKRRESVYHGAGEKQALQDKNIILVDDGIATGYSIKAAILALTKQQPASITVAIPVAESSSLKEIREMVNDTVCLYVPKNFHGVAQWYEKFPQLEDQEVCNLLSIAN